MNEIIYKVYFHPQNPEFLTEDELEYMVPLEKYDHLYVRLPVTDKVRFLFFNLLFNTIDDSQFEDFLNFHFDNFHFEKKDFLRIFKWDLDQIFHRFEIPWKSKKRILINPAPGIIPMGSIIWDKSKIIIENIMPFFESYDYATYLKYKRRYKEAKYWINSKKGDFKIYSKNFKNMGENTTLKKPINEALRRPVAFCVGLDYEAKKFDISNMTKDILKIYIREKFKDRGNVRPISSVQKVVNTLLGYLPDHDKEKAFFEYDNKTKKWKFREDNYAYMKDTFPDDYKKAMELFDKFK